MTIAQMLSQSGILTLLGMCVVFSFLIILIGAMYLLHYIVHACRLDKDLDKKETTSVGVAAPAPAPVAAPVAAAPAFVPDAGAVVAAIAAAVREKQSL